MTNYKNITLFEGLNSLRFFAAFLVVLHHAETIRKKYELPNFQDIGLFRNGDNAVTFFFVLSGFLITYLLLKENKRTNTISIKNFYIKRVLRIWPLYFLLVIIGTLIVPFVFELANINYQMPYTLSEVWFYFLFFLPGLVTYFFGHHLLEPLWSIGIEEVFYLIWAPLFKIGKQRIFVILVAIFVIKVILLILAQFWIKDPLTVYLIQMFRFEAMAIGGLGAFFIFNRKSPLSELGC
ncbi:acyltransferase [bacterium]|nr:acyltransferase [bacterium]